MPSYAVGCFKGIRDYSKPPECKGMLFHDTKDRTSRGLEIREEFRKICRRIPDSDLMEKRTQVTTSSAGEYFLVLQLTPRDVSYFRETIQLSEVFRKFVELWTRKRFETFDLAILEVEDMVDECILSGSVVHQEFLCWRGCTTCRT
ncbi:hypothetical protein OCU04_012758 [Sclerotinia nivalis]|uniref:Uncharacterized protein n=1 Tax=Sclerotinia nivalis TaxID=352851 RepID=A0A9X0A9C1_9HELO|nr:hypothetical protein OCU04_012758 [Sclerotinia nivalis]